MSSETTDPDVGQGANACRNCGAPPQAGLAECHFCKAPLVADTVQQAIPCPRCRVLNAWGAQKCASCQTWVVVQCVFCHAITPHHLPACLGCHESFAGAPERLAQRQAEASRQRNVELATNIGGVAATFLGAVAGSALISGSRGYGGGYGGYDAYADHGYERRHHEIPGGGFFGGGGGVITESASSYDTSTTGVLDDDADTDEDTADTDDADDTADTDDTDDSDDAGSDYTSSDDSA